MTSYESRTIEVFRDILIPFFFHAEDGIRDYKVTAVQTCALPIISHGFAKRCQRMCGRERGFWIWPSRSEARLSRWRKSARRMRLRSEEHTSELQSPCNL